MALRWCGLVLVFLARANLTMSNVKSDQFAEAPRAAIAAFISSIETTFLAGQNMPFNTSAECVLAGLNTNVPG